MLRRVIARAPGLAALVVVVVAPAACLFDDAVPIGAQILCRGNVDCPERMVCVGTLGAGRCLAVAEGDKIPPAALDGALSATRMAGDDVLEVTFRASEPLGLPATVQIDALLVEADAGDGDVWSASIPAASIGSGVHAVIALLVDESGNPGATPLGAVDVDVDAPRVVDGSVAWAVSPPPQAVPRADGTAAPGSTAALSFSVDDLFADDVTVRAVSPGGVEIPFAFVSRTLDGNSWSFALAVPVDAPDGAYEVTAALNDDVGNEAQQTLALPAPGLVVSRLAGSPCAVEHADGSPACTDVDGDGFDGAGPACPAAADCDDTQALVHPGGLDIGGDGVDDDCSGSDAPADDGAALFVAPAPVGSAGAAGSRADPLADLDEALARALDDDAVDVIFLQSGDYTTSSAVDTTASLIGALDADWAPSAGVTRITAVGDVPLALTVSGDAPARLARVVIDGAFCTGVFAAPGASARVELAGVTIISDTTLAGCDLGDYAVVAQRPTTIVGSRITASTFTSGISITSGNALSVIDSDVTVSSLSNSVGGIDAEGPLLLLRSRVVSSSQGSAASGLFIRDEGAVIASSVVDVSSNALFVSAIQCEGECTIVHSDVIATAETSADALSWLSGTATLIANRFVVTAGTDATLLRPFGTFTSIGNAIAVAGEAGDSCAVFSGATCTPVAELDDCTGPCVEARDDVAVAAGATAPTVAAFDLGAPSGIAMDRDGDCRAAVDVEAGADELP